MLPLDGTRKIKIVASQCINADQQATKTHSVGYLLSQLEWGCISDLLQSALSVCLKPS